MGSKSDFDVVIVGGGPGGLSAALWCSDLGLTGLVLERNSELGGQLLVTHNPIKNYLGVEANNGRDLRDIFMRQIEQCNTELRLNAEVIDLDPETLTVTLAGGEKVIGRSIVIATGVRRRTLNIPGEVEFAGRGILESGVASKDKVAGKNIVIIGGGDAALENAIILGKTANKVTVIHRRDNFAARREFLDATAEIVNIEILKNTVATAIVGGNGVEAVETESFGNKRRISADAVLVRVGVEPNTDLVDGYFDLDEFGYLIANKPDLKELPRIFAVGDVANKMTQTLNGAVGEAASALKTITSLLS